MPDIEATAGLRVVDSEQVVQYTYEKKLAGGQGDFRWVFDEGELVCSAPPRQLDPACLVGPDDRPSSDPGFVYMDCGAWVDDADGKGRPESVHRDLGLVYGPHVYLCRFVGDNSFQRSRFPAVEEFLRRMSANNCGVRVVQYARATVEKGSRALNDQSLYLFLPDFHMPPVTWFFERNDLSCVCPPFLEPPAWLARAPTFRNRIDAGDRLYAKYYILSEQYRRSGQKTRSIDADIFREAGGDLVKFLRGLAALPKSVARSIHMICLGDLFELWINRDYQFQGVGYGKPQWRKWDSPQRVAEWALEVMIWNAPIFEAFQLVRSALPEVKFLWGNHDGYTLNQSVTALLGQPCREPSYEGMGGELHAEHGHRFDSSNRDNLKYGIFNDKGPMVTKYLKTFPQLRQAEGPARVVTSIGRLKEPECYFLGASLLHLYREWAPDAHPFTVFVMAHTHRPRLERLWIRTKRKR